MSVCASVSISVRAETVLV